MTSLKAHKSLEGLWLEGTDNDNSFEWLGVSNTGIGVEDCQALQTNHTLVYLNLAGCDMDSDGACQLASELCTNYTLQTLFLGENQGEEDIQKLIDSLTHNTTVKELHLPRKYKSSIDSSRVVFTHGVALSN